MPLRVNPRAERRRVRAPQRSYLTPDQIREWREVHGVTQMQLASLLYLDVRTIRRWEAGTHAIIPMAAMLMQERRFRLEAVALGTLPVGDKRSHYLPVWIPTRSSPKQDGPRVA